ncbi:MAG: tRNA glutamyl-Q(34) synthetase GluQRS [Alphaproteobacteria bacterium]|nr:tRNA glutamyl-Q(34) synthetase GluQRS [Alphaproteobacteria bacterium]MBU0798567.1 tRNA glutamyl-Q(34) synthetase GluQRS [Alphaproteobacteria bacterium]MBU0889005.1 tRNA glutamyl-Q(34) synthetase GluQRS [Alphaproteobacteria bacterium]MBU1814025.1 tRNA glutamyl-Q(34) synthetase GluQRS [Alphaproteobacteria bacterium]
MIVTRFAPSPTGYLHLGHAYSALIGWRRARAVPGGRFLLRIEDIDPTRCRPEFEAGLLEDLAWLGLDWDGKVRRQSDHMEDYRAGLERLENRGLLYPCFCTRSDIAAEIARAGQAPHGPEGLLYPGLCRTIPPSERARRVEAGEAHALRLDMAKATALAGPLDWQDETAGRIVAAPEAFGDIVLARKETPTSYHLSVTLDDALQGVTLVTRGTDLFEATHIHRLLQALLDLPVPSYAHHPLLAGPDGRRYAKRDKSLTLRALRQAGRTPAEVRAMVGLE